MFTPVTIPNFDNSCLLFNKIFQLFLFRHCQQTNCNDSACRLEKRHKNPLLHCLGNSLLRSGFEPLTLTRQPSTTTHQISTWRNITFFKTGPHQDFFFAEQFNFFQKRFNVDIFCTNSPKAGISSIKKTLEPNKEKKNLSDKTSNIKSSRKNENQFQHFINKLLFQPDFPLLRK